MSGGFFVLAAVALSGCADVSSAPRSGMKGSRIVALNQDSSEMQAVLSEGEMTVDGVRKYFFGVSKGGLTHFLINPNAHNTAYASKVWDPVWHEDPRLKDGLLKGHRNSKVLHDHGVDWVQVMVDACREQGVSPWISMRMNDIHNIGDGVNWACSKFWLDHPEFRRKSGKLTGGSYDSELAFDFTYPEVREHALALVREMLGKWDVDGIEFDWLRFPHHVNDAAEQDLSGCAALTAFMREAKRAVDEFSRRRGKSILVCARVAAMPKAALGLGTDAVLWAREGLVDWVAPCNFFSTADFVLPYVEWREKLATANPKVRLVGAFDFAGVDREGIGNPQGVTLAEFCGYLERMYAAGVVDFETFNLFTYTENPIKRFVQIEGMPDGECWVRSHDRAYPVTYHDAVPRGYPTEKRLPADMSEPQSYTISIGRVGDTPYAVLLMAFDGPVESSLAEVTRLNGVRSDVVKEVPVEKWMVNVRKAKKTYGVKFPARALKDGENRIWIGKVDGGPKILGCELFLAAPKSIR